MGVASFEERLKKEQEQELKRNAKKAKKELKLSKEPQFDIKG